MVIISKTILKEFIREHPDAENAIQYWYEVTSNSDWRQFSEVKKSFNSADAVGNDRYVFDIKGNQYRLVALILFSIRTVFILFVGTHQSYDKIDAGKIEYKK
jgi:mRNA interferase HigB